jgi:ribonuclease HII
MMSIRSNKEPNSRIEAGLYRHGIKPIAGLDEAGRGSWAGPLTAAAVILPPPGPGLDQQFLGLRDSKQLTAKQRRHWEQEIRRLAVAVSLGVATVEEIDEIGILPATRLAMRRAVYGLSVTAQHLMIDYILVGDVDINQTAIPRGDSRALSIAAASVVAKVARDRLMIALDQIFPGYGFAQHKGYGTRQHQSALTRLGPSPAHRYSFEPTQRALAGTEYVYNERALQLEGR